ncbi:MAG TPA: hypothetical protein VHY20_13305, partial [Pirellulales bacterium]|nr:hypothetical protein [Pirellulales bacterium]
TEIGSSTARPREAGIIVRLYDINDLFAVAPNYEAPKLSDLQGAGLLFPQVATSGLANPAGGGMGGGGGFFAVADAAPKTLPERTPALGQVSNSGGNLPSSRTSIDTLIEAIQSTIAPTSWAEVGGEGKIARLGNSLLISADSKTHGQIEALLSLFRQRWKTLRTVTLRANWLWLSDEQLAALLPEKPADGAPYALVDDAAWQKRPRGDDRLGPGYRAVITCYNGQTVNVVAGGQTLVVTSVHATSSKDTTGRNTGETTFFPTAYAVQEGAGLQITPLVSASGKYVVLDVHSRVAKLHPPAKRKEAAKGNLPQELSAAIDHAVVVSQQLATTLRVPVGQNVLIGGMTFEIDETAGSADLYLFINATMQELQDENPPAEGADKQAPDAKPAPDAK